MALPSLRIDDSQAKEFKKLSEVSPATFDKLLATFEKEKRKFLTQEELKALITEVLGPELAEALTLHVIGLGALMRRHEATVGELMDSLTQGLQLRLSSEEFEQWQKSSKHIEAIFGCEIILTSIKTVDLSYEYTNLLNRAAVLTDVRPIFSSQRDQIVGGIVAHILRIAYFTEGGERSVSIALDERDLRRLRAQCDRALDKAIKLAKFLENKGGIRGIGVTNEPDDRGA